MKGLLSHITILLVTLAIPAGVLAYSLGPSISTANPVSLAFLVAGLLTGNFFLYRFASRMRFRCAAWLFLKGFLLDTGWTLAVGLWIAASITVPVPPVVTLQQAEPISAQEPAPAVEEAPQAVVSAQPAPLSKIQRYTELVQALQTLESELRKTFGQEEPSGEMKALLDNIQSVRISLEKKPGNIPAETSVPAAVTSPGESATGIQTKLVRRTSVAPPASVPATPTLPPLWRYALMCVGYLASLAGLIIRDKTLIKILLKIFPFVRSEEQEQQEKAEKNFDQIKEHLKDEKVNEALTLAEDLDIESLSHDQREEAEFYQNFVKFKSSGAESTLPLLERHSRQFPEYRPAAYLLGYAYLSCDQNEKALEVWERIYNEAPDFLETKYYYSLAALKQAKQFLKDARVNEALPLFTIVKKLGIHSDSVPEGLQDVLLMEAAGKLRSGEIQEAEAAFRRVEKEGKAMQSPEGNRLTTLGELGRALVDIGQGEGGTAMGLLDEVLKTVHGASHIQDLPRFTEAQLFATFEEAQASALQPQASEDTDAEASGAQNQKAQTFRIWDSAFLRDLYFLRGIATIVQWQAEPVSQRTSQKGLAYRDSILQDLQKVFHFDPTFPDALAVYGFVLYFFSKHHGSALSFLKKAMHTGFEEEIVRPLLDRLESVAQLHGQVKTEILDRLHEYFTNEEVPRRLKEELLKEEAIRSGYRRYYGDISLDDIKDKQPTLQDLSERNRYLADQIRHIVKGLEAEGKDQQKLEKIKKAMGSLENKCKSMAEAQKGLEEDENVVLRESGIFVLSEEF